MEVVMEMAQLVKENSIEGKILPGNCRVNCL